MFNYRIIGLLKREFKEKLLSKAFIISTLAVPLIMILALGFQALIMSYDGDENTKLEIITEDAALTEAFKNEFSNLGFVESNYYTFEYKTKSNTELANYLEEQKKDLLDEKLNGIIFVSDSSKASKKVKYFSKVPNNPTISQKISRHLNKVLVDNYFADKDLSKDDLSFARTNVALTGFKISEDEDIKEEGYGKLLLSYLFTFLLYISLLMIGQTTMQSVMEEKMSRVVEVLLSSVNSKEFLTAKILGASIIGVVQMMVWLIPIILVGFTTLFTLPMNFELQISAWQIFYLLLNFFIGLLTFLSLFVTVGAIYDNPQDAQSAMGPLMMLIIIPFFISFSLAKNPGNLIAEVSSMLPFFSIIVMPARMTLVDIPIWQFVVSIAVNLLTIYLLFPIAGKIFRIGLLKTGKKPTLKEVGKWLKYD
ncbi:MAG: hypothetical protein CR986_02490 [Ignavibacteriae bacterium]|nr:MAG: hypothetical protein CR986_02490 [Ignavibacteriota bacterium]